MRRFVVLAVSAALLVPCSQVVLPAGAAASVDGTYSVLAGGGVGDGLPATSVYLPAVAAGTDAAGATYLADTAHARVRRVDPGSGVVSTVAGVGEASGLGQGYAGDGGPATAAQLSGLNALAVTAAGDVYVATNSGAFIRRVDHATGTITRVAGAGGSWGPPVPTSDARTSPMQVVGLAVDNGTGDVYLADYSNTVWVLHPNGSLAKVAGTGTNRNSGDGGPAVDATLRGPWTLAVLPDHDLLIGSTYAIRRVDHATGVITTVAGSASNGPDLVDGGTVRSGSIALGVLHVVVTPNPAVAGGSVVYFDDGSSRTRWFHLGPNGGTSRIHTLELPLQCRPAAAAPAATVLLACERSATYRYDPATSGFSRVAGLDPNVRGLDRSPDGTPVAEAAFAHFEGVAAVGTDTYVSTLAGFVYRLSDDGLLHVFAGAPGSFTGQTPADGTPLTSAFLLPGALAPAPGGGLYLADQVATFPQRWVLLKAHDGVLDRYAGADTWQHPFTDGMPATDLLLSDQPMLAAQPNGDLFLVETGDLYVIRAADRTVHRVPFDPASLFTVPDLQDKPATADTPINGIAAAPDGTVVVSVAGPFGGRIARVDPDTGTATTVGAAYRPGPVAALSDGTVVAVDTAARSSRLMRFAPDGGTTVLAWDGSDYDGGALTAMKTGDSDIGLGPLAAGPDGTAVVANNAVGRVERVQPGTMSPALPALTDLHVEPGAGAGAVRVTWSTAGLPAGTLVRLTWRPWPSTAPVDAFEVTSTTAPATAAGVTLTLEPGLRYMLSGYLVDGSDRAGTSVSPPVSDLMLPPGDTSPPIPYAPEVLSLDTTASFGWGIMSPDVATMTTRLAPGTTPPGPGDGTLVSEMPAPWHIWGSEAAGHSRATGLTAGQTYSVSVFLTDWSGNVSSPASLTFVAGSAPRLRISGPADGAWVARTATMTYRVTSDTPTHVLCEVDGVFTGCPAGTLTLSGLAAGRHQLAFTPRAAGGSGQTVRRTLRVDADTPRAVISSTLPAFTQGRTIHVPLQITDASSGVASHDLRYRTISRTGLDRSGWHYPAAWRRSTSANTLGSVRRGYTVCFSTRARDRVGNISAWSPDRCTTVLNDDRALTAGTAGWTRGTNAGYYAGTWTQAWRAGRLLELSGVGGRRVALLVTMCPACGSLRVTSAGGSYAHTVDLSSASWRSSVLVRLPDLPRPDVVTIAVRSTDKRVRIDGVGVGFAS